MKSSPLSPSVSRRSVLKSAAVLTSMAMVTGLAACSSGSGGDASSLTFWISTSVEQQAGYDQLAKAYEEKTGTKINVVNIPYDGYATKLRSSAQANDLPDVARVASIDPIWTKATMDLADIVNNEANKINKDLVITDSDGSVMSIPSDVTASGMFINASLFEAAGVTYPTDPKDTWTWDEFLEATTKVRNSAGAKYNLTFDSSPSRLRAFQYQMGGNAVQGTGGSFASNDKTVGIYETFKKMNDDAIMPKSVWTSGADANALFKSGQVAAYFSGVWQIADFESTITNFKWAAVPSPAQPVHATDLNYGGLTVAFDNSDAKGKAAHDFVAWMYAPENYKVLAETNGFLSVETGLDLSYPFESKAALDGFELYNREIELADPISGSFAEAQVQWALNGKALADDPTVSQMGAYINGQQDAQTTLANIIAGYDKQVGGE
ncbi:alpha-1,4-digalacturonate transport system substrate-binding protein [Arthrobacter alpinus]|uniref:Alpha-1,4-digalacturonate transport system substrate-binding protein n=2 Tax=Arthrobacter alpinus TaxID=656366 RepID=A0A1H5LWY6_9MICC|nr:alpha-1,4-digalacturonate transport system substrate-binding protein [Arthrobacter alpinus]